MTQRRLAEVELLRLKLAQERVNNAALALRLVEHEMIAVSQRLGLGVGDRVTDDGLVTPADDSGNQSP